MKVVLLLLLYTKILVSKRLGKRERGRSCIALSKYSFLIPLLEYGRTAELSVFECIGRNLGLVGGNSYLTRVSDTSVKVPWRSLASVCLVSFAP